LHIACQVLARAHGSFKVRPIEAGISEESFPCIERYGPQIGIAKVRADKSRAP
jgi:hypothetical protein